MDFKQEARRVDSLLSAVGSDMQVLKSSRTFDPDVGEDVFPECALASAVSAGAASLPLDEMPDGMPAQGVVSIGDEMILYELNNSELLDNLTRGFGETQAASHEQGATVAFMFQAAVTTGVSTSSSHEASSEGSGADKTRTVFLSPWGMEFSPGVGSLVACGKILGKIVSMDIVGPEENPVLYKAQVVS